MILKTNLKSYIFFMAYAFYYLFIFNIKELNKSWEFSNFS